MKLANLRNKHVGTDIYVIGSGPSLSFLDSSFFQNKIVVCVNHTIQHIPIAQSLYLVAKEPTKNMQQAAHDKKGIIVMCRHHSGLSNMPENKQLFPHITAIFRPGQGVIEQPEQLDALERSSSTIVSGIHLAAYMGAKNIILVGHDCGIIDGNAHVIGYSKERSVIKGEQAYKKWMVHNKVEAKTLRAKKILKDKWNVNVYSLNPFINFKLEGHNYQPFQ